MQRTIGFIAMALILTSLSGCSYLPQGINILLFSQIAKRALRARQFEFFNEGFGERNFLALFESIELDQI